MVTSRALGTALSSPVRWLPPCWPVAQHPLLDGTAPFTLA
jgi:hypothetical protein